MAQIKISELELNTQMSNEDVLAGVDTSEQKTKKFKLETLKTFINKEQDEQITKNTDDISANASNIETNAENISNNSDNIEKNAQDIAENKDNIADNTNRTKRIENTLYDSGEASGTSINIKDSTLAEFQEISVDGVCEQTTTQGYNLYDNSFLTNFYGVNATKETIDNGFKMTITEISSISTNIGFYIRLKEYTDALGLIDGESILIKYKFKTSNTSEFPPYFGDWERGLNIKRFPSTSQRYTEWTERYLIANYNASKEYGSFIFYSDKIAVGDVFEIKDFMICRSDTDKPYEPYTSGVASPSPSYPQEIEVIEGSFDIKSIGRSLVDFSKPKTTSLEYSYKDDVLTIVGKLGKYINIQYDVTDVMRNNRGKNICFQCENASYTNSEAGPNIQLNITFSDGKATLYKGLYNLKTGTITVHQIPEDLSNLKSATLNIYTNNSETEYENTIILTKPILLFSDTKDLVEFEPYLETKASIQLPENEFVGKLSETLKDQVRIVFNEDDGKYHAILDKKIGRDVFDGTQMIDSWISSEKTTRMYYKNILSHITSIWANNQYSLSNALKYKIMWLEDVEGFYFDDKTNNIVIRIDKSLIGTTKEEINNYLSENPIEFYYPLLEPYEVDLGVVEMPLSYSPETNVFTTSELEALINAKYYRNFINTIQNLQVNEKALKEELVDIQNQLKALQVNVSNLSVLATNDEVESESEE